MSASIALSVRMQDIASSLNDVLRDITGEKVIFALVVQTQDKVMQYVSNGNREDINSVLEDLLARRRAGRADIPAHYNPDLKR